MTRRAHVANDGQESSAFRLGFFHSLFFVVFFTNENLAMLNNPWHQLKLENTTIFT